MILSSTKSFRNAALSALAGIALVTIPADIDALLAIRPDEALAWRHQIRETLCQAFAAGFAITGFRPALGGANPAYLLERRASNN